MAAVITMSFCDDVFMEPDIMFCQLDLVLATPSLASMTAILPSCKVFLAEGVPDCAPILLSGRKFMPMLRQMAATARKAPPNSRRLCLLLMLLLRVCCCGGGSAELKRG